MKKNYFLLLLFFCLSYTLSAQLVINEVLYDPPAGAAGDANGDGTRSATDDEFVELINNSVSNLDISGYKFYEVDVTDDSRTLTHTVPSGTILAPSGIFVLFGGGIPTGNFGGAIVQISNGGSWSLNNSGERLEIDNSSDTTILTFDYDALSNNPDESYTRDPDITGEFVQHVGATGSGSATFSPGTMILVTSWTGNADTNSDWETAANWTNGVPVALTTVIIPNLTNDPVASGSVTFFNMVIESNASLTVNGAVNNTGVITTFSGASFVGQTSVSGSVTYKRNLPTADSWYLVSSPVAGETIEDVIANHTFATGTSPNIGFSMFNNTGAAWTYASDALTGSVMDGKGYSVRLASPGDISFTGTANTSDVPFSLTQGTNNYNLVGNPFTAFINSTTFLTNETTNLETTFWMWNGTSYDTRTTGTHPDFKIAPGQGFFVEAKTTNDVTFTEALQSHESSDTFQKTTNSRPEIKLSLSDGSQSRKLEVFYIDGTTIGYDNGFDGKQFGGVADSFSIYSELISENVGVKYAIQSLPNSNFEAMVIPVGIKVATGKEITFTAEALNLPSGIKVFLEDKLTNMFTRLDEANTNYKVTLSENINGIGRFYLHTKSSALSVDDVNMSAISIYKTTNSNLRIVGLSQGKSTVKLYNMLGKEVLNTSFTSNGVHDISLPKLATGIYIVSLETETGKLNRKITFE